MAAPYPWLEPAVVVGGLAPMAALATQGALGTLGADPIAIALNRLGLLALILLVAAMLPTPLKTFAGLTWPLRVRRAVGLLAFAYACAHVLLYALIDQGAKLEAILADVVKRPFITVGLATLLCLVPLAWTSTDAAVRRLGFVRWKRLHRLAYLATALGVLHFFLRVKRDVTEPAIYAVVLALLFAARLVKAGPRKARDARAA